MARIWAVALPWLVNRRASSATEAELTHARAVVAAFEASPGAGALSLDGRMIDRPHLLQAQRTLAAASGR